MPRYRRATTLTSSRDCRADACTFLFAALTLTLAACSHGPKTVSGDLNQLLAESPTAAGAAPPSQALPPIAVNPGDIAPWKNPYYANALAPGYWLEFSGSNWGTPIAQWKNSQLNELGYPRYLKRGKGLRAPLAGYGAAHPELSRGQVVLTWRGDADIRLSGATEFLADKSNAPATGTRRNGRRVYRFDGDAALSDLVIHRINAPVTDIKVWLPDPDDPEHASLEGELWHPVFIERLKDEDWGVIRATSLTQTNGSPLRQWGNRYRPRHVFATGVRHPRNPAEPVRGIAGHRLTGVPYEHLVALANATDMDLWIDVPHGANDVFVHQLAKLLQFGSNGHVPYSGKVARPVWAPLENGRRVFVAYSDRLWSNDEAAAPQGVWAAAKAKAAGMSRAAFVARRTAQAWRIFEEYFGDERLVRVAATSATHPGYTRDYLGLLVDRTQVRPDIVAVESYFGGGMPAWIEQTAGQRATGKDPWYYRGKGSKTLPADDAYWRSRDFARHVGEAFDEWQRRMRGNSAAGGLNNALVESIGAIVGDVPVVTVGGPALRTDHLDAADPGDEGVTLFAQAMNRNERIADMYRAYLDAVFALGVAMHVPYVLADDAMAPGQWGHLEHVAQAPDQAPKYQALRDYIADNGERPATPSNTERPIVSKPPLPMPPDPAEAPPVAEPKPAVVGGSGTGTSTGGETELLADWRRPGNWKSCEKVNTVGAASLINSRLRVTVKRTGKMGVRVYQKVTGLVPGRTYRVTGRRFRGSQKSVGVRVSSRDCYNGTLAQDYGFNDNPNIDLKFKATKPYIYLSLYGGRGHAATKSHIEFASLSVVARDAANNGSASVVTAKPAATSTPDAQPASKVAKPASTPPKTQSKQATTTKTAPSQHAGVVTSGQRGAAQTQSKASLPGAGTVPPGYKLYFADEFNYQGRPDPAAWDYDVTRVRNGELQCFTDARSENVRVEQRQLEGRKEGYLVLELRKEPWRCPQDNNRHYEYTSGAITSRERHNGDYLIGDDPDAGLPHGIYEIRAKIPSGRGTWPALWLVGHKPGPQGLSWPKAGEIDIMEAVGYEEAGGIYRLHSTLHRSRDYEWPDHRGKSGQGMTLDLAEPPSARFRVWRMIWKKNSIEFFVDGQRVRNMQVRDRNGKIVEEQRDGFFRYDPGMNAADAIAWPFSGEIGSNFKLIFNLAYGGGWGGQKGIDDSIFTRGPVEMLVDYVRIYTPK